jgi:hypothetical protein
MKRSREIFLWTFFLALCFWAGYLKGYLPLSMKQRLFVGGTFRILNAAPFDFPKPFLLELERETGQKIEVRRVRNWDELQAQLVTRNGPNLLFAPSHWSTELAQQDLILKLNPLQTLIEKNLSPDFVTRQDRNLNLFPLYWTLTDFRVPEASFSSASTLEGVLADKLLAEVHLYPDTDLIAQHLGRWAKDPEASGGLKLKDVEGFNFKNIPKELPKNSLWEVPRIAQIAKSRALQAPRSHALMVYGMMIPRNSANKKLSYRSLETLLSPTLTEMLLAALPLGTTLRDSAGELKIRKSQRAAEIRELNLNDVIILTKRDPEGYQALLPKFNFVF